MSHTKGEWTYHRIEPYGKISGAFTVKTVFMSDYPKISTKPLRTTKFLAHFPLSDEDGEVNARLISAAPDLLEFVQQIFNGIDTGNITIDTPADETLANVLLRGRAALSKATGAA